MQEFTATDPDTLEPIQPKEPIVLNPGLINSKTATAKTNGRSALKTLGVLVAGWFFGNLILLAFASAGIAIAAGSTGLIKVPFITERFFGPEVSSPKTLDQAALQNAQEKLSAISTLQNGQTLKSLALDEEELNALLQKQIESSASFPLTEPKIKLEENEFVFTGRLVETNAPIKIVGEIAVSGLVANVEIRSAKFGRVDVPSFVANNLVESYLSQIGLSLSDAQLPAKSIRISEGLVSLIEVSKVQD